MSVNSICSFTAAPGTECASSPNQGSSSLEALLCVMNNKKYLFSSASTAQPSLAATGPVILRSPVFWGEYVAAGF